MSPENRESLSRLLLSLNHRLGPTVFLAICRTEAQRQRMIAAVAEGSQRYKHLTIDLGPHHVHSLRDAIARFVPKEVRAGQPLEYVVHFTNLSYSLFTTRDGKVEPTPLIQELNYERERLFHDYPFISILWESPEFLKRLFYDAGDLFTWLVDRYEFEADGEEDEPEKEVPEKDPLSHKGADAKRLAQITRLRKLLQQLDEGSGNTQKYLRERTDTLLSLGHECIEAYQWEQAENYLQLARRLVELHYTQTHREGRLHFYFGELYRYQGVFDKAIAHFENALQICKRVGDKTNEAATYHHIAMLYQEQERWNDALKNYGLALELSQQMQNEIKAGITYHQIGMVYAEQGLWEEALKNYSLALEKEQKMRNEAEFGGTYHQIGRVYHQQGRWEDAFSNYKLALEWHQKSGNELGLAITYYQMGSLREEQGLLDGALEYYQAALKKLKLVHHPNMNIAEDSIARVTGKLDSLAQSNAH